MKVEKMSQKTYLGDWLKTVAILSLCTLVSLIFEYFDFHVANIITIYILGVQLNAVFTNGRLYSLFSSILSVLVFNYFFTEPRFTFAVFSSEGYPITFLVMLLASLLTSSLTKTIKEQNRQTAEKAYRTEVLLETDQKLQKANNLVEIWQETASQLVKLLNRDVVVYPVEQGKLLKAFQIDTHYHLAAVLPKEQQQEEKKVQQALRSRQSKINLPVEDQERYHYVTIKNDRQVFAVVGITQLSSQPLDIFEKNLLTAVLGESALAIEKEILRNKQHEITSKMEKEQLRANLLRTISHDLRTPLAGISGTANILLVQGEQYDEKERKELYLAIYDDALWLIHLVENLLSITKFENDTMKLNLQAEMMDEIIAEAAQHLDRQLTEHHFEITISPDILLVKVDAQLMIQVIVNLVNNAIKYTPVNSHIYLTAKKVDNQLQLEVKDDGTGIAPADKEKIFEQFYTAETTVADARRGLGLGLSLCREIVQAHGGQIYVGDNQPQGAVFGFTLPLMEVDRNE